MAYLGQTYNIGGVAYFETDYVCINLNRENQLIYGEKAKIFVDQQNLTGKFYVIGIKNKVNAAEQIQRSTADPKCGTSQFITQGTGAYKFQAYVSTPAVPKYQARGLIRTGPLATTYATLKLGQEKVTSQSLQDVLNRFNAWLASGVDNESRDSGLEIWFKSPGFRGGVGQRLTTRDDVIEAYSNHFMHEQNQNK